MKVKVRETIKYNNRVKNVHSLCISYWITDYYFMTNKQNLVVVVKDGTRDIKN